MTMVAPESPNEDSLSPKIKLVEQKQLPLSSSESDLPANEKFSLWRIYRDFVRNHSVLISLLEDALSQVLFWTPQQHEENSLRWREVMYGLLMLQRTAVDMAQQDVIPESYGTTVAVADNCQGGSATSLRVGITVVHNLLPTVLQLCHHEQRPRIRCFLEQIKCALRLVLLGSYWYRLSCDENLESTGLLMNGGMYWPHEQRGRTVEEEQAQRKRQTYVGRRTGRIVMKRKPNQQPSAVGHQSPIWKLLAGEVLHMYRPLHWALVERRKVPPSPKDWLLSLGIDGVSLLLLQPYRHSSLNNQELRRRKLKLLLYLMRSPIFDKFTEPAASTAIKSVGRTPVVGQLLETYLLDWLAYWKHPFASEED